MFRRREEGLFDNNDSTQETETTEASSASASASPSSPAAGSTPVPPSGSRFAPESARNASSQSSNNFRSGSASSQLPSELQRNRLPEAKSSSSAAPAAAASSAPSAVFTPSSLPSERGSKTIRRVLTVGNDILLKGEIATCDRLVIEGKVDATLNDVHTVEIAETGSFKGSAHIEDAEISGLFEGDLVVRGRLVIYATGKVRGKISYGEIEIERGGELSGEIKLAGEAGASARPVRQREKEAA